MRIAYRSLWTVEVRHAFRGGASDELEFVIPSRTARDLAGARAIPRSQGGRLHVLVEVDETGAPVCDLAGKRFVFGLRPRTVWFWNYTGPLGIGPGEAALYSNDASPHALGQVRGVRLVGERIINVSPQSPQQPDTVRVLDKHGNALRTISPAAGQEALALPGPWPVGPVTIEETGGGPPVRQHLFVEPDLAAEGAWGLLDLAVHPDHIADGARFVLQMPARADRLRYYIVAHRYSQAEFDALSITDTGFLAQSRSEITFARMLPPAFGPQHLPPALLDAQGTARIALFEAQSDVDRREHGLGGIALRRNGDVLIGNLAQPGTDRVDAQFLVHLSKP